MDDTSSSSATTNRCQRGTAEGNLFWPINATGVDCASRAIEFCTYSAGLEIDDVAMLFCLVLVTGALQLQIPRIHTMRKDTWTTALERIITLCLFRRIRHGWTIFQTAVASLDNSKFNLDATPTLSYHQPHCSVPRPCKLTSTRRLLMCRFPSSPLGKHMASRTATVGLGALRSSRADWSFECLVAFLSLINGFISIIFFLAIFLHDPLQPPAIALRNNGRTQPS